MAVCNFNEWTKLSEFWPVQPVHYNGIPTEKRLLVTETLRHSKLLPVLEFCLLGYNAV
jgi:hypothetical protein